MRAESQVGISVLFSLRYPDSKTQRQQQVKPNSVRLYSCHFVRKTRWPQVLRR